MNFRQLELHRLGRRNQIPNAHFEGKNLAI